MKKCLFILLILTMISPFTFAETDTPSDWALENIEELQSRATLRDRVFFNYHNNITRQEFIYLAVRVYEILNETEVTIDESIVFTDTSDLYALKGATLGITSGVGNNKFDPNANLTREQLAVLMMNTLKLTGVSLEETSSYQFQDDDTFSSWAKDAVYAAKANGVISGIGQDQFSPKAYASNEVALIITNKMLTHFKKEEILHPEHQDNTKMTICYDVILNDFSGDATVKLNIQNITDNTITIKSHGYHGFNSGVKEFISYDVNGDSIDHKFIKIYDTSFNTEGYEWAVYPNGKTSLTLEYTVDKQSLIDNQYKGYIGNGYGLFTGEQLIGIFPSDTNKWYEDFHVVFHVPSQANIITPWANKDGIYYPNRGFYADNKSHVDKEDNMMQSTIAIGDFSPVIKQVGQTEVRVALPNSMPSDERDKTSEDVFTLIAFYNTLFGKSIGDYYMLAYAPETHNKKAIWAGEWSLSQGTSIRGNDYALTMVAHQLFHRWNGWTWGWESDRDTLGPLLMEGNNRYYEAKSILMNIEELNHTTRDDYNYLNRLYEQYKTYYTKNEVIKYIDSDAVKDGIYSWTAYGQGALIWLKLDLQILDDTDGKISVDDLMHLLDDTYGRHKGNITLSLLKKHLKELTGNSYDSFFEDYIYNTTYLELESYFEDDDKDGYPNYYELLRGGNPTSYTSGAPIELKSLQNTSQVLVIGSREPCEIFHQTHGIGQDLTGNPTSSQLNDASMIILLDSGRYGGQFNIFKDMTIDNNQMVVQTIEGKQYIYIKTTSDSTLLKLIETLSPDQMYTDGLYNLN